jgi:hypothetical protein
MVKTKESRLSRPPKIRHLELKFSSLLATSACLEYLEEELEWAAEFQHLYSCIVVEEGQP